MASEFIDVSDDSPRAAYTATASQTAFTVPFVFFSDSDLVVYQNGDVLVLDTDYTVSGEETSPPAGSISLTTGATVGDAIQIVRVVPYEQTTHIPPSGPLDVPAINIQFSKFVAMIQQIADTVSRSFRLADNVSLDGGIEGSPAPVAGEYLKWNADGNGIESTSIITPDGTYAISTQSEAEDGTLNDVLMTPLRTREAIEAQAGSTGVGQFGVVGDGVTDVTDELNAAIAAGNVTIPAGDYVLSGDIIIPSDRLIWVQTGATLTNTGGRMTGYLVNNVHIRNDGWLKFLATDDGPALTEWLASSNRGMIELGGAVASPGYGLSVTGNGKVSSDYVFTSLTAPGYGSTTSFELNRKGICFFFVHDAICEGQEVTGMYGEAIYCVGSVGGADIHAIRFQNNNVHDVQFSGLNFNTGTTFESGWIVNNRVKNAYHGIEASGGTIQGNKITDVVNGFITGGGGGAWKLFLLDNTVANTQAYGYSIEFSSTVRQIQVRGNIASDAGTHGFVFANVQGGVVTGNYVYNHGNVASGSSYTFTATANSLRIADNVTDTPGAHSAGNFNNAGTNSVGTNPVF